MKRVLILSCCLVLSLGLWGCAGLTGADPLPGDYQINGGLNGDPAVGDMQVDDAEEQGDADAEFEDDSGDEAVQADADEELLPVEITTESVHGGAQGSKFSKQTIKASGGSHKYLWEITGALPAGLEVKCSGKTCAEEFIAKSISLTGTPTEAGSFDIVVTATDVEDDSLSDEAAFTIEIASKPVEQNGDLEDRLQLTPGANMQVIGSAFQASAPAPKIAITGPKVINVEKAFPNSAVSGVLVEPLEFEVDVNGGQLPYKEWKVQYLAVDDYELTIGPGGTMATLKVKALYPRLNSVDHDPKVTISASVTDANGKTATAETQVLIKYPLQNINDFAVNACLMHEPMTSQEHCTDSPGELSMTFYHGDQAMVTYNQFGGADGMRVAYGGIAIPITEVDRITADEVFAPMKTTHERFTKITVKSAYWWAEYVPAGGEEAFYYETDLLEKMTDWDKDHPNRIWHRVGDNIGKTTNGGDGGCGLTQQEIDEGYMCL